MGRQPGSWGKGIPHLIVEPQSAVAALSSFDLVIFDLDNTLYEERTYLTSAYAEIGKLVAGTEEDAKLYSKWLEDTFLRDGRRQLFQKFLIEFHLGDAKIETLLHVLRTHKVPGGLPYFSWVSKALGLVGGRCALVTNGNPSQQKNKLSQLEPSHLTNKFEVFLANEIEPKPSPAVFKEIKKVLRVVPQQCLVVGDSEIDHDFALAGGAAFMPVRNLELALNV